MNAPRKHQPQEILQQFVDACGTGIPRHSFAELVEVLENETKPGKAFDPDTQAARPWESVSTAVFDKVGPLDRGLAEIFYVKWWEVMTDAQLNNGKKQEYYRAHAAFALALLRLAAGDHASAMRWLVLAAFADERAGHKTGGARELLVSAYGVSTGTMQRLRKLAEEVIAKAGEQDDYWGAPEGQPELLLLVLPRLSTGHDRPVFL